MASTQLSIPRGDEKDFTFALYITESTVRRPLTTLELTGVTLKFTVKRRLAEADSAALFQLTSAASGGITLDAANSKAVVTIPKAVTETAKPSGEPFFYDLRMIDADGNPHTFVSDMLDVLPNVTRTVT